MKLKLALYRDIKSGRLVAHQEYQSLGDDFHERSGRVRVSDFMEVDFFPRDSAEIKTAESRIRIRELKELRIRRDELLAAELPA